MPRQAPRSRRATCCNHTNGIEEAYGDPGEDDDVYERMVDNIADAPQVFPLGHTHGYSAALGYAILARILEVTRRQTLGRHHARSSLRPDGPDQHEQLARAGGPDAGRDRAPDPLPRRGSDRHAGGLPAARFRPRRQHHLDDPRRARDGARPAQRGHSAERKAHRLGRKHPGDDALAGAGTGPVPVRAAVGAGPHRV